MDKLKSRLYATFKKFHVVIAAVELLALVLLIALSLVSAAHFKRRLAEQLTESFRTPLLSGDMRSIVSQAAQPISRDFSMMSWTPMAGSQPFSIPDTVPDASRLFSSAITVPVFFDEQGNQKAGDLIFYYNTWLPLSLAFSLWVILLIVSIPIITWERKKLLREQNILAQSRLNEARATLAHQVAHDIRSPLAALDAALGDIALASEDKRILIRSAVGRIHDIANDLIQKNQAQTNKQRVEYVENSTSASVHLLSSLINPLITEKRLQYRTRTGVAINFQTDESSYGLFALVQPVEFKRVLSNLINNAAEALGDKGSVAVTLDSSSDEVHIKIQDDGPGIPPEIIGKLGQKGETHGKTGGSGLGLYHAKKVVRLWQGNLDIKSAAGQGTTVTVTLPKAKAPGWFVSQLVLMPNKPVVILDDDVSIHQVWQGRLDPLQAKRCGIETVHFSEPDGFLAWVKSNESQAKAALYLSDYELLGHKKTGLDLAQELNIGEQTILVTSHYEESSILERCQRLKVRMIPKNLAAYIPIRVASTVGMAPRRYDAVLIDDDLLVRKTWEIAAKQAGKAFAMFSGVQDFLKESNRFSPETSIYIDNHLGDGVRGENESKRLHEMGFKNIYLATGSEQSSFSPMPWIQQVIGKEAPWG